MYKLRSMANIQFVKSNDSTNGEDELVDLLNSALQVGKVLWLLSGGSNIEIESRVSLRLEGGLTKDLAILLSDERYGPIGHSDSNYLQLTNAGFDPKQAYFPPVLNDQLDPESTLDSYQTIFSKLSQGAQVIGQFGIGDDGHIAGILPDSPATTSKQLASYYETPTFKRVTLTFEGLKAVNIARVFCFGDSKRSALEQLKSGSGQLNLQPALILSQLEDVKVYNDQI